MTIASTLTALNQDIQNARTAITAKGGTVTVNGGSSQLATDIATISTGSTIDSLTITPTTSQQTITASGGTDGYSPITVNAVTSAIDANIQALNIKDGVSILGVSGSVTELNGETRTEQLNSTSGNTYTPTTGKNAITSITVTPKNYARTVAPQTTQSVWAVPSGYSGHGNITVSPVTSAIDANIQAGNIKSGVTILGVTGNYGGGSSKYGATIDNLLGDIDSNGVLQAPTGEMNLVFSGAEDLAEFALAFAFYSSTSNFKKKVKTLSFPDLVSISGQQSLYDAFHGSEITTASFPELTTISGTSVLNTSFQNCKSLASVSFPKLTAISGVSGMADTFTGCTALTSVSFPELTTISGASGMYRIFSTCSNIVTVNFPKLATLSGNNAMNGALRGCTSLTDAYFNALTTTSFGSYVSQFNNLMQSTGSNTTHTLHFPSNLQSTISGLTGYPLFGGTSGYVTLAFDLPATS